MLHVFVNNRKLGGRVTTQLLEVRAMIAGVNVVRY